LAIPEKTPLCLDAGCGTGLPTALLSAKCDTVIALDYSLESLKMLRRKGLQNVVLVQADLSCLPFKDSAFDACVCANALNQFGPDGRQERAVSELERVTKVNGVVSLSVHHYSKSKQRAGWIKEGKPGQEGIDYIFRFSRDDLLAITPRARIKGVGYYGLCKIPYFGARLQDTVAWFFGRLAGLLGIGHMLTAVFRKQIPNVRSSGR
jgi:ubiquinone/menaquinone biosynthesis C-methylase UbiE